MSTVAPPQHQVALAKANEIRLAQARVLNELRPLCYHHGCQLAATLLIEPDEIVARIRVDRLLKAIKRMGRERMPLMLEEAEIPPGRLTARVGPLPPRIGAWGHKQRRHQLCASQRVALAAVLRRAAGRAGKR